MVMAKKSGEFEKAPPGVHLARCIRLIDLGTQLNQRFQNYQHKVRLVWELPQSLMQKGEAAGKPYIVSKLYTLSLSEKSHLRNDLKSWRGRDFTDQELDGFDLNAVVDKCCMLNVVHENDYANIAAIMPLPANTPVPTRINDVLIFDLSRFDQAAFDQLSDKTKETIKASLEYQDYVSNMNNENQLQQEQADADRHYAVAQGQDFNDDIPF